MLIFDETFQFSFFDRVINHKKTNRRKEE